MSTRGAVGFYVDGRTKVAYTHSDSYPDWLGAQVVLPFCRGIPDDGWGTVRDRVRALTDVDPEETPTPEQVARVREKVGEYALRTGTPGTWYDVLRSAQGELGTYLKVGFWPEAGEGWLLASLFCEWAYLVNLDDGLLEVYRGFNRDPGAAGRYAGRRIADQPQYSGGPYYGVRLVAAWPLAAVPAGEEFLARVHPTTPGPAGGGE